MHIESDIGDVDASWPRPWLFMRMLFASVVLYLLFLRRWLKRVFMGTVTTSATDFEDDMVGRFAKVTAAIAPPKTGRVMVGDAEWTASAAAPIAVGADVKVVARDNLTVRVEPV